MSSAVSLETRRAVDEVILAEISVASATKHELVNAVLAAAIQDLPTRMWLYVLVTRRLASLRTRNLIEPKAQGQWHLR